MRLQHQTGRRNGFTLVELIVAAGLTLLIMAILATGFQAGLQSLSQLKSAGDLADRLRTAETLLRQDLDAPHFENGTNPGTKFLSDFRFDIPSSPDAALPLGGFVQIRQPALPATSTYIEGIDQDGLTSTRATQHGLSLSVKRTGKTPGELFAAVETTDVAGLNAVVNANPNDAVLAANTFISEWAEVHWFLDTSRPVVQNGVSTFPLCRRVLLLTKNPVPAGAFGPTLREVVSTGLNTTNTPQMIASPTNRLGNGVAPPTSIPPTSPRFGDDIVMTNVVSFEVKPTWESPATTNLPRVSMSNSSLLLNADYPFDELPAGVAFAPNNMQQQKVFDTSLGGTQTGAIVTPIRVTGVQIKIRVYDAKNKFTRQCVVTSKL